MTDWLAEGARIELGGCGCGPQVKEVGDVYRDIACDVHRDIAALAERAHREGVREGMERAAGLMDSQDASHEAIAVRRRDDDMEMAVLHKSIAHTYGQAAAAIRAAMPPGDARGKE